MKGEEMGHGGGGTWPASTLLKTSTYRRNVLRPRWHRRPYPPRISHKQGGPSCLSLERRRFLLPILSASGFPIPVFGWDRRSPSNRITFLKDAGLDFLYLAIECLASSLYITLYMGATNSRRRPWILLPSCKLSLCRFYNPLWLVLFWLSVQGWPFRCFVAPYIRCDEKGPPNSRSDSYFPSWPLLSVALISPNRCE